MGVQCFRDRVRSFTALENEKSCESKQIRQAAGDYLGAAASENSDMRPGSWKAYDNPPSLAGTLKFSDRNYPELPDLGLFAASLAQGLGGCGVAIHGTSVHCTYKRHNISFGRTERVIQTTHTYQDQFVYKKSALKGAEAEKGTARQGIRRSAQSRGEKTQQLGLI